MRLTYTSACVKVHVCSDIDRKHGKLLANSHDSHNHRPVLTYLPACLQEKFTCLHGILLQFTTCKRDDKTEKCGNQKYTKISVKGN